MEGLGRLEWVDVREVWKDEPGELTPWLAQNIDRLSEVIGVELELETTEAPVGESAVDIVGTEVGSDRGVVIENQLEATDHTHLGQLITYAAGRKARVVIWVSPDFNDAHRSTQHRLIRQVLAAPGGEVAHGVDAVARDTKVALVRLGAGSIHDEAVLHEQVEGHASGLPSGRARE
jgi:stress-induced morphogen